MKEAYLTFLFLPHTEFPTSTQIISVDKILQDHSRRHEIVLALPFSQDAEIPLYFRKIDFSGPVTFVYTNPSVSGDEALIAGLGRAVGDFIFEWRGNLDDFTANEFLRLVDRTNYGYELVELETFATPYLKKLFYRFANSFRSIKMPIHEIAARVYSRRALSQILFAKDFESRIDTLFAELPLRREVFRGEIELHKKVGAGYVFKSSLSLLINGSRFGSIVPLVLSALSAIFGVGVSLYALVLYFTVGKSPEGWTTIMITTGLGQASILALLGLLWTKIDSIGSNFNRNFDATSEVEVIPPKKL